MTSLVVDASVAVKWYVREAGSDKAVRLLADPGLEFLAPDIFHAEVVNALLRQAREGQLPEDALASAMADIREMVPGLVRSSEVMDRAARLARALDHPIYDCLDLALAEAADAVLVTADAEFVSRCRKRLKDEPATARLRLLEEFQA